MSAWEEDGKINNERLMIKQNSRHGNRMRTGFSVFVPYECLINDYNCLNLRTPGNDSYFHITKDVFAFRVNKLVVEGFYCSVFKNLDFQLATMQTRPSLHRLRLVHLTQLENKSSMRVFWVGE